MMEIRVSNIVLILEYILVKKVTWICQDFQSSLLSKLLTTMTYILFALSSSLKPWPGRYAGQLQTVAPSYMPV